jgi:pimeloyl-ACP methyl ester carboxylesterase
MIREMASGVALLIVFALPHGQASTSAAIGGEYVDVGGSNIWYEECGSSTPGPDVVLLHDGLVHSITWDDVWAPLCLKYHVLRYDRRGYGRSQPAKTWFVPEDDLLAIMHRAHFDRAIIIGNSSGGGLALDFALAHPEMVTALFLIGPVVHGMASTDYFNERGSKNNLPLAHGDLLATAENWSKDRFLIAGDDKSARKKVYDALAKNPQNLSVTGRFEVRPMPPSALRLSQIKVPTLVLVGDADIGDVFAYSGAIEAAVPLASLEIWRNTGHLIQIQRPAKLVARFDRFVALANRREVSVSETDLTEYVGSYKLFNSTANVVLREGHLILEVPGRPYYWLFASSETRFFLRTEETEIEFQKGMDGIVTGMTIHNNDGSVVQGSRTNVAGSKVAPDS